MPRIPVLLLVAGLLLSGAPLLGEETAAPVAAEDVTRWIEELDASQFVVRETAMQNLIAAGPNAIAPLVAAIDAERWELNLRCVYVLQQIALCGDPSVEDEAREALEMIAAKPIRSASQRARETLASIGGIRQQRALQHLVRLGAKTLPDDQPQVVPYVRGLEFNEQYTGTIHDLRQLKLLTDLEEITLAGPQITDEWMPYVLELPELFRLTLNRTAVTDAGLAKVHTLQKLRLVEFKYVPITDGAIPHLSQLTQVTYIRLFGTQMTEDGAERLQAELDKVASPAEVDYRRGAFLGVGANPHALGCSVIEVRGNTAASRAGIVNGDVIVRFQGERVDSFDGLTRLIAKRQPGDKVSIEFVRQAEMRAASRLLPEEQKLGLQLKPHALGCQVAEVADGSLAQQMGLRPDDCIFRYNGQVLDSPATFEALFAATKPGENVSIDYAREVELRRVEVTLGEFD